jgi:hypothetical protein
MLNEAKKTAFFSVSAVVAIGGMYYNKNSIALLLYT